MNKDVKIQCTFNGCIQQKKLYMMNNLTLSPQITPLLSTASGTASDKIWVVSRRTHGA
jgi:hypothetical protein